MSPLTQEYRDLAAELFVDGCDAVIYLASESTFDPATLSATPAVSSGIPTRLIFVAPQQSTQIQFERELADEEYRETKVASISYFGSLSTGSEIETADGRYYVTGLVPVNPLGDVVYYRVRMSR